ncbi:MAG: LysM peptidoglycan-binding domain-containing protein [Candidatus Doudnabacteria bacterium]|nr:LysM peptidoglycan-binding domain-containing protein [Candidatus Doudnabacteria bacterium]
MDKVKIKRVKRNKKEVTTKEKILAGIGVGGTLMGGIAAASAQKEASSQFVSVQDTSAASASAKIKQSVNKIFGETLGVQAALADDSTGMIAAGNSETGATLSDLTSGTNLNLNQIQKGSSQNARAGAGAFGSGRFGIANKGQDKNNLVAGQSSTGQIPGSSKLSTKGQGLFSKIMGLAGNNSVQAKGNQGVDNAPASGSAGSSGTSASVGNANTDPSVGSLNLSQIANSNAATETNNGSELSDASASSAVSSTTTTTTETNNGAEVADPAGAAANPATITETTTGSEVSDASTATAGNTSTATSTAATETNNGTEVADPAAAAAISTAAATTETTTGGEGSDAATAASTASNNLTLNQLQNSANTNTGLLNSIEADSSNNNVVLDAATSVNPAATTGNIETSNNAEVADTSTSTANATATNNTLTLNQIETDPSASTAVSDQLSNVQLADLSGFQAAQGLQMSASAQAGNIPGGLASALVNRQSSAQPAAPISGSQITSAGTYTVKKGDTLYGIAQQAYGNANGNQWRKILSANPKSLSIAGNTRTLRIGYQLNIPALSGLSQNTNAKPLASGQSSPKVAQAEPTAASNPVAISSYTAPILTRSMQSTDAAASQPQTDQAEVSDGAAGPAATTPTDPSQAAQPVSQTPSQPAASGTVPDLGIEAQ